MKGVQKKYVWVFIPLLFLLYSAPSALDYVFHFPDEKYYTDAVLQMMDKDDYFTPYKADGSYRFLKPIATYWTLIGSYKILGVSKFSSRVLFWLAGALLVAVVFFMTKSLTKKRETAITAAFITAANPLVLMSSSRSIPDILLVLFLTISAWGFLEIMVHETPSKKFYWMAYLGAAFAFETKGLPAAAFAGISLLYLLFNPWQRKKLKQVLHPGAILLAVFIALSWFVVMYIEHGSEYLNSFFADQVGYRVSSKIMQVVNNTFLGVANLIAFTLPWIVIAFSKPAKLKAFITGTDKPTKAILGFIAIWTLLVIAMSGAVFKFYDRYLLPVIPLISLFFALVFMNSETRFKKPSIKIFAGLAMLVLAINILYAVFILPDKILVLGTIAGTLLVVLWLTGTFKAISSEIILANLVLLLFFSIHILLYPLLMPNPGEQLTEAIQKEQVSGNETVYVYGNIRTASNIRIHSHHKMNVVSMDTVYTLPENPNHLLVFSPKEEPFLDLKNYSILPGSEEWKRVPVEKFPSFLQPTIKNIKKSGTKYFVAKPK
ncbi:4-amino-4-deoxy-L-arabinose transferase [Mariniphaga anaerophila]|uniref:4-amino-4-deoxy-L-arabinose transferase n=1 Tax=Mariniphaga anaerophila TaxID=1484053 RepID=A0A1M5ABG0_9BACT|nr:glycosyltransferase family 39 protein [Mariniphaga anaerophila]SHF27651.1 4-amino-4-deoxy-L-arabinose transferase [Mariniphaga anaerophila]